MKPTLLATIPSSGSSWIADCYSLAHPEQKCTREFFSATYNWRFAERIQRDVGDMMYSTVPLLSQALSVNRVEQLLEDTWKKENWDFTKECHLAWSLESFSRFFDCIVLVRSFAGTFPPSRARVVRWYEHLFCSLQINGLLDQFCDESGKTPTTKAAVAHYLATKRLVLAARQIGCPLVVSDKLDFPASLASVEKMARQTERKIERPQEHLLSWSDAIRLHAELEVRYGQAIEL
jgi:hypothetical protein